MMLYISLQAVLALIAGILILVFPRLLSWRMAICLLIVGINVWPDRYFSYREEIEARNP